VAGISDQSSVQRLIFPGGTKDMAVQSFCGCLSLREGSIVTALVNMFIFLFMFFFGAGNKRKSEEIRTFNFGGDKSLEFEPVNFIIGAMIFFQVLLLIGIHLKKTYFLAAWIIVQTGLVCIGLAIFILLFLTSESGTLHTRIFGIIMLFMEYHFMDVVASYKAEMYNT